MCKEQIALAGYVRRTFAEETLTVDAAMLSGFVSLAPWFGFTLFEWELFILAIVCTFDADGMPRWPDIVIFIGRGGGKDKFIAFLSFCLSSRIHGIKKYDVDICANSEEQAKRPFQDVYDVLESDIGWKQSWRYTKSCITNRETGANIQYRANSPKSRDGMRSGFCIFNEVHQYQNWANITVFTTGMGKVAHPRRAFISSNGHIREGVYDLLLDRCLGILHEGKPDNGYFPFICRLDALEDVHDEANWAKANPSLPFMPNLLREIRKEYIEWVESPAASPDFMTKRFGLPQGNIETQVTSWENLLRTSREPDFDLHGRACVFGVDFARTSDFVSVGLLFRDGEKYHWMHHSWWCTHSNDASKVKAPISEWADAGFVTIVDAPEIHPSVISEWLYEKQSEYDIVAGAIDDYRYTIVMRELEQVGYSVEDKTVRKVRPSDHMRISPVVNSLFRSDLLTWGDDPVMRWFTNNTKLAILPNSNGNYKYDKIEPQSRKTDGFMAFAAAMCVAEQIPEDCPYELMAPISL